jgi:hypothetical protein
MPRRSSPQTPQEATEGEFVGVVGNDPKIVDLADRGDFLADEVGLRSPT